MERTVSKALLPALTVKVTPGVGSGILKNSSMPPRAALGLGCTLPYRDLISEFVIVYGNAVMLVAVWQELFNAMFGASEGADGLPNASVPLLYTTRAKSWPRFVFLMFGTPSPAMFEARMTTLHVPVVPAGKKTLSMLLT